MIRSTFARLIGRPLHLQAYCWLLSRMDDQGQADASPSALAAALDISLRRAKYALRTLKTEGFTAQVDRGRVTLENGDFVLRASQKLSQKLSHADHAQIAGMVDGSKNEQGANCPSFCPSFCPSSVLSSEIAPAPAAFSAPLCPSSVPVQSLERPGITEENRNREGVDCPSSVPIDSKSGLYIKNKKSKKENPDPKFVDLSSRWVADSKKRHPGKTRSYGKKHIDAGAEALRVLVETWKYDWKTEIRPVLLWARNDPWWSPRVLSLGGLAKRMDNGNLKFENIGISMDQAQAGTSSGQPVRQVETISLEEYRQKCGGKIKNSLAL